MEINANKKFYDENLFIIYYVIQGAWYILYDNLKPFIEVTSDEYKK